jgi:uncharacterized membrane protein YfcA
VPRLLAIGLAAGIFSALFGVGGGTITVPLLILLVGFSARQATATSLGAIGMTALAGVFAYAVRGEVDVAYAALVGVPATAGVLAGAALQQRVPAGPLTLAFSALLAAIGVWLLVG